MRDYTDCKSNQPISAAGQGRSGRLVESQVSSESHATMM